MGKEIRRPALELQAVDHGKQRTLRRGLLEGGGVDPLQALEQLFVVAELATDAVREVAAEAHVLGLRHERALA